MNFLKFKQMSPYHPPGSPLTGEDAAGVGDNRDSDSSVGFGNGCDHISMNGSGDEGGWSYACGHVSGAGCCGPDGYSRSCGSADGHGNKDGRSGP